MMPVARLAPVRRMRAGRWLAAACCLLLVAGAWFITSRGKVVPPKEAAATAAIVPGSTKATLTLSDGKVIELGGEPGTTITDKDGVTVINLAAGQLSYTAGTTGKQPGSLAFNTLATPKGGEYQVILPDGTTVWLNSASSLRYPVAFTGAAREVELNGEAYFEVVASSSRPFKVTTGKGADIEVLGTGFNINAYPDEAPVKTTLVEGSVRVGSGTITPVLLKAGQQSVLGDHSQLVTEANVAEETAWKNGYFEFNELPIREVMKRLARWYDFEFSFEGPVKGSLTATIARKDPLEKVFELLQQTKAYRLRTNGRHIIVSSL
jgi:ferric-dicitrate binding protein FerR (iron transport regulator)